MLRHALRASRQPLQPTSSLAIACPHGVRHGATAAAQPAQWRRPRGARVCARQLVSESRLAAGLQRVARALLSDPALATHAGSSSTLSLALAPLSTSSASSRVVKNARRVVRGGGGGSGGGGSSGGERGNGTCTSQSPASQSHLHGAVCWSRGALIPAAKPRLRPRADPARPRLFALEGAVLLREALAAGWGPRVEHVLLSFEDTEPGAHTQLRDTLAHAVRAPPPPPPPPPP